MVHFDLELARVNLGDKLASFDGGVEIGVNRGNGPGVVASDLHRDYRVHRSGGGNSANHVPDRNRLRDQPNRGTLRDVEVVDHDRRHWNRDGC